MGRHARDLVIWMRNYANGLSYLGSNGMLKQQLYEAASLIEEDDVHVEIIGHDVCICSARGPTHSRVLTWRERLAMWLLRGETEIRP